MNMFKGLLFLQGHFTHSENLDAAPRAAYGARTAAGEFGKALGNRAASDAWFGRDIGRPLPLVSAPVTRETARTVQLQSQSPRRQQTGLLDHLLLLGGRPMHAGNNFDIEEPFEQLVPERVVAQPDRRRAERRIAPAMQQTQTCTG